MSWRRTFILAVIVPASLVFLSALFLAWVAATGSGLKFAARVAEWAAPPGLGIESPTGTLLGPLQIGRIVYESPERRLVAEAVVLQWQPSRLLEGLLLVDRLDIGRLRVLSAPDDEPPERPRNLTLPLAVRMEQFHIGQIGFGAPSVKEPESAPAITGISGRFASDGRQHSLERLQFATARLGIEASGELGGQPPFPVSARARIGGEERGHPFTVAVAVDGSLSALAVDIRSASGSLKVDGAASLDLFAAQPIRQGRLTATGFDPAVWVDGAPHAELSIDARIAPAADKTEILTGEVEVVNGQPGGLDEERIPLRRLVATLRQEGEHIRLPDLTATLLHGEMTASALWADGLLSVNAKLANMDASAWHRMLTRTRFSGDLTAQVSAASQQVKAELRDPRFRLQLDASRSKGMIHIATARLAARGGRLELNGQLDPRGKFDLAGRLQDFDPGIFARMSKGRLNASLDAQGQLGERPAIDLHFALRDSRLAGRPVAGRGDVVLTPERLQQADITLQAGDNRIDARGALGAPGDELKLSIEASRLEQVGLGGALYGDATLVGPLRAPGAEWRLESSRLVLPDGTELRDVASRGRMEPGAAAIDASLAVGSLDPAGDTPTLTGIALGIDGQRGRHRLQATARVGQDHGLALAATGGLDSDWIWKGQLETVAWRGPHPIRLAGATRLEVGPRLITLGKAAISGEAWRATLDGLSWQPGRLQTSGRFSGLPLAAFLPAKGTVPSTTLRVGGEWDIDFGASAAGRVRLFREEGDLVMKAADNNALALGLERLSLAANFSGNRVELSIDAYGIRAGTVDGGLTASLRLENGQWTLARQAPWHGRLDIDTPSIAWLSPLAGDNVLLGGRLHGALSIAGTPAAPAIGGQVSGNGMRVRLLDYGLDLGGGTLRLEFTPEEARLQRLEMFSVATQRPNQQRIDFRRLTAEPGRLSAEGEVALKSGAGRIRLRADQLAVSELPDRWVMVSGTGDLRFTEGHLAVGGDLAVDAAYVELPAGGRPTLSQDVVVVGRPKDGRRKQPLDLDFKLDLGDSFYFQGAGIESRLAGSIHLVADQGDQMRAHGTVRTVGGTFDAYGRKLTIERGILNLQGLLDNPGLNVRALRKNLPVEAGVEVTGTLKDPRVRLVSEPGVPDTEKLSWMVLGRSPEEGIGAQDADLLLSAAMALRGGNQGKGPLQSLVHGLGLEELGISAGTLGERSRFPSAHVAGSFSPGGATAAEQIATVGKRLSSNTVLSYERSITSTESILKLTVELSRRLSLVGRIGANNSIGFLYSFAFGGKDKKSPPTEAAR